MCFTKLLLELSTYVKSKLVTGEQKVGPSREAALCGKAPALWRLERITGLERKSVVVAIIAPDAEIVRGTERPATALRAEASAA